MLSRSARSGRDGPASMRWLRHRWPVFLWAAAIWIFSTSWFSAARTAPIFQPLLHWLLPWASADTLHVIHGLIRKCAHIVEYFIFGLLILRAIRGERQEWHLRWAIAAVAIAAAYAATDELHQAFVPTRGPSMYDVLLDTVGATLGQLWVAWRSRRWTRRSAAQDSGQPDPAPRP